MDQCVGVLVVHEDGSYECSEGGCLGPDPLRHEWRAGCGDLDETCSTCRSAVATRVGSRRAA